MTSNRTVLPCLFLVIVMVLAAGQCLAQTAVPALPNPGSTLVSRDQQRQLGFQAAAEIYKQMPVLPDNSVETQYVRQLGQRLAATIPPETSWPFEFHVVPQKEINAFALPGGPMFVNIGTITAAKNEEQLAGVMAHEMAHVYMQHSAKQMQKAQLTQGLAGLAGAILGGRGGTLGSLAQAGVQVGAGMVMLKYSRTDEAQADAVGAVILYKAGYNPIALADFFKTLEAEGGSGPQFLSDHPNPENRELAIRNQIQNWPAKSFPASTAAFTQVSKHAIGVKAYTANEIAEGAKTGQWDAWNKSNGAVFNAAGAGVTTAAAPPTTTAAPPPAAPASAAVRAVSLNDVMPSSRVVTADLGAVRIVRPENWDVIAPQQQGQFLTIAPRPGVVRDGIGYGVVMNTASSKERKATIDQMTAEIVRGLQSGGDMKTVGSTKSITVAGARGRSVIMQSTSPFPDGKGQPQKEKDWLVTIPRRDGSVLFLVFVAPEAEFQRFQPTFEKMLKSVKF